MKKRFVAFLVGSLFVVSVGGVQAVPLTSPNYQLDANVINSFGGQGSSTNYRLVSSGGEAVVGNGSGGSYKLNSGYVSQLEKSIELNLTENSLQAYYPLNTNIGTQTYDATANNYNGSFVNGPTWITGKIGSAVNFDGVNDHINLGSPSGLGITGDLTLSAWVNPTDFASNNELISWANVSTTSPFRLLLFTDGRIRFICTGCTTRNSTGTVSSGVWSHIAVTISGSTIKFYINGSLSGTQNLGITPRQAPDGQLYIGRTSGNYFKGGVDELKIHNRSLSDSEVRSLYDANMAGVASAISIPQVVPGIPQTAGLNTTVITDAGGYDTTIAQNNNLTHTDTSTTIAATTAGTVSAPGLWNDGSTTGLGFTLTGGTNLDTGKWGTGPVNYKYAAIPGSATTFFSRTGLSGGVKEVTNMLFKLDVPTSQKSGEYSNQVTITATLKP